MKLSDKQIKLLLDKFVASEEAQAWIKQRREDHKRWKERIDPNKLDTLSDDELKSRFLEYFNEGAGRHPFNAVYRDRIVRDVKISAGEGDKVLIPPNYGHVTINPAGETLKIANFVARHFASIYEPYRRKGGAAYFELTSGKFVKNENYGEVPEIRFLNAPSLDDFGIYHDTPMYELIREPHKLEFLTRPEKFKELFERALRRKADERVGVEK